MLENNSTYTISEVTQEAEHVTTLKMVCDRKLLPYKPGQFITVFFPETGHVEGKSYSISSAPHEKYISITVKDVGVFSHKLATKKVGDTLSASLPYGYFYSESKTSTLVIVTGGIGIAPFRSMILDSLCTYPQRKICLLYANKTKDSTLFRRELDVLKENSGGSLALQYYITQEEAEGGMKQGRIPVEDIVEASKTSSDSEVFICGGIAFVREYWKALKNAGIKEESIYTEAFF